MCTRVDTPSRMPRAVYPSPHTPSKQPPLTLYTSIAISLGMGVLGKRSARILNVGWGLTGREGKAPGPCAW